MYILFYFIMLCIARTRAYEILEKSEDFRKILAMLGVIRLDSQAMSTWMRLRKNHFKTGSCWIIRYNVIARKVNYLS